MLFAVAVLIIGGIYHTEVAEYVADLAQGSSNSGGGTSVVDTMQDMGNSGGRLMGGVGSTLGQ